MQKFSVFCALGLAILGCGCAGTKQQGFAVCDPLEAVKIEQMTGNHVSGAVFDRTIVCLNARRETRWVTAVTNQTIAVLTNIALNYLTNQTVSLTTNQQQTLATNLVAAPPRVADTNAPETIIAPASTNLSVTTASNVSATRAGNGTTTSANFQTQRSRQVTTTDNNVSITTADNQLVTAETNLVVTVLTNMTLTSVTNLAVILTNLPVQDHFLVLEYTPPTDFTLAPGESLVLLVDGARYQLAPGTTQCVLVPRKGFSVVAYKATPQLFVDLANAKQVKLRVKGTSQIIERAMSQASRTNLKKFLVKFFAPDGARAESEEARPVRAHSPKDS